MGRAFLLALVLAIGAAAPSAARVVKFEMQRLELPTFEGREFGLSGAYEKIAGRATIAVDPQDGHNAGIVDIDAAPRNAADEVELVADVYILTPVDPARGNGKLFYDVVNRGRKLGLVLMNDAPDGDNPTKAADAGNGFLMREGYTIVWSGWQGDTPPGGNRMDANLPVVPDRTGPSREEFVFDNDRNPAIGDLSYPAADLDPDHASLTVRERESDARARPDGLAFKFLSPTRIEITRPAGFDSGAIYELVYTASDPKVMGLGFAAVRDVVSFLRYETGDLAGGRHPLAISGTAPSIRQAYALGISQSGRFLRDMLYQGFNEDEAGRKVFDGLMPHIAGARKTFVNARFAQPGRFQRQHEDHLFPGDQFPFAYAVSSDALTGRTDGILRRCLAARNCPLIIHTDSGTEIMQGRASLNVTDTSGRPLALPETVRAFLLTDLPHFNAIGAKPRMTAACQAPLNPLHAGAPMRALLKALDRWVSRGEAPPGSRYPSLADGTLVPPEDAASGFPALPGFAPPGALNLVHVVDQSVQPPLVGAAYPVLVPPVDGDGHDRAGIRLPAIAAPIATYLGWNRRAVGFAEGELCGLAGSMIPLPRDREARLAADDPRLSLAERYPTHADYVGAVRTAVEALFKARLLLDEDAKRIIEEAEASAIGTTG